MNWINRFLNNIPRWLSGKVSIFIYLFLFCYLVIFALLCALFPGLHTLMPSQDSQLVLGNYTNVLSALGASIAAGSGVAVHRHMKIMHANHQELKKSLDALHRKIDGMSDGKAKG